MSVTMTRMLYAGHVVYLRITDAIEHAGEEVSEGP